MHHLQQHGVSSAIHYPGLIPDQPAMQHARFSCATPLETARSLANSEVSLPIHPYLTDAQLDHIIETVNRWTP
jgi:dTDP-4-amino-4,6-dideoxygalactose transaminase